MAGWDETLSIRVPLAVAKKRLPKLMEETLGGAPTIVDTDDGPVLRYRRHTLRQRIDVSVELREDGPETTVLHTQVALSPAPHAQLTQAAALGALGAMWSVVTAIFVRYFRGSPVDNPPLAVALLLVPFSLTVAALWSLRGSQAIDSKGAAELIDSVESFHQSAAALERAPRVADYRGRMRVALPLESESELEAEAEAEARVRGDHDAGAQRFR